MSESPAAPGPRPPQQRGRVAQLGLEVELDAGRRLRIGPRQIELLDAVRRHGSISAAARSLGVSFRGAWLMLEALERWLGYEILLRNVGGRGGGGAVVSARGGEVLELLAELERRLQDGLAQIRDGA